MAAAEKAIVHLLVSETIKPNNETLEGQKQQEAPAIAGASLFQKVRPIGLTSL